MPKDDWAKIQEKEELQKLWKLLFCQKINGN